MTTGRALSILEDALAPMAGFSRHNVSRLHKPELASTRR